MRLSRLDDGRIKLRLRTPWSDGTTHLILEPLELIEKLIPLIPKPKTNLIVYHGALASRAQDREKIVAYGRPEPLSDIDLDLEPELFGDEEDQGRVTHRYYTWSELMLRVWGVDSLECPRCSGRLRFIKQFSSRCFRDRFIAVIPAKAGTILLHRSVWPVL